MKCILFINKLKIKIFGVQKCIMKQFEKEKGYKFSWDNPITFNEKIQKRKIENIKIYSRYADKLLIREYVKKNIGEKYLIPI